MRRLLFTGVLLASLLLPVGAQAQSVSDLQDLLGSSNAKSYSAKDGVAAKVGGSSVTFTFSGKSKSAIKALRGHRATVRCDKAPPTSLLVQSTSGSISTTVKVAKRAKKLKARLSASKYDACVVTATVRKKQYIITVATTPAGLTALAERAVAENLTLALGAVFVVSQGGKVPSTGAGAVVVGIAGLPLGFSSSPLADAGATPGATGQIGYWGDGDQHAVVAALSPTGRRLFIEIESNGVIRSNTFLSIAFAAG